MPSVAVISVSEWLIENSPDLRIRLGTSEVPCSSGLQFASRYPFDPTQEQLEIYDYLPESLLEKVANLHDLCRCLVFDKWTGNADARQAVFVRKRRSRYFRTLLIDQGYCFGSQWDFPDSALCGVYANNRVYTSITNWESFEPALTKAEQADILDVWRSAEHVPPEWYEHDTDGLHRIAETLHGRRRIIRELIDAFRKSSRNPFPNWLHHG